MPDPRSFPVAWVCLVPAPFGRGYTRGVVMYTNSLDMGPGIPTPSTLPQYCHLVVATTTRTVGHREVRILLECFLVYLANDMLPLIKGA